MKGSLDSEAKPTVHNAQELELGTRRKTRTDKGKQHELQRLMARKTVALCQRN